MAQRTPAWSWKRDILSGSTPFISEMCRVTFPVSRSKRSNPFSVATQNVPSLSSKVDLSRLLLRLEGSSGSCR